MRTELVNFAISRYLPAIRQVSQPVFLPICPRMCALHSGTKGPAWRPPSPSEPSPHWRWESSRGAALLCPTGERTRASVCLWSRPALISQSKHAVTGIKELRVQIYIFRNWTEVWGKQNKQWYRSWGQVSLKRFSWRYNTWVCVFQETVWSKPLLYLDSHFYSFSGCCGRMLWAKICWFFLFLNTDL